MIKRRDMAIAVREGSGVCLCRQVTSQQERMSQIENEGVSNLSEDGNHFSVSADAAVFTA